MKYLRTSAPAIAALCMAAATGAGQSQVQPAAPKPLIPASAPPSNEFSKAATAAAAASGAGAAMRKPDVLGPDDQVTIHVTDAPDISDKPYRIDNSGELRIPRAGRIQAAGLTAQELEAAITERLKSWLRAPDVTVLVAESRSQPVSILGAVKSPGVKQIQGQETLFEVLSDVGGIADDAGYSVKITRRLEWGRIPLPSAADDPTGRYSVAEVGIPDILAAKDPSLNILICPQDVISVPRAELVYVLGQVPRAGGYVLQGRTGLSLLQALTLAGGIDKNAAGKKAKILRPSPGGNRIEIPVDLPKVMAGKAPDQELRPQDILFLPSSNSKKILSRIADIGALASTAMLYRIP